MNLLIDAARVALAAFLLAAAVLKLVVRTDLVVAAARLGVPRTWLLGWRGRSLRPALVSVELLLAAGLMLPATARIAAAVAAVMLLGFAGLLARAVRRGETGDCGCSGTTGTVGWPAVVRNAIAGGAGLAVALLGVVSQPSSVRIVIMIAATVAVATAVIGAVQIRAKRE
jgi:Methylamine utilisation protein MauE